jgi:CHAT domain-containing protein
LPFEALVTNEAPHGVRYLLDVGPPVIYAPSATVLWNLAQRPRSDTFAKEPVLTVGDPAYGGLSAPVDAVTSRLQIRSKEDRFRSRLARLPYSGKEARWVEEHFAKHGVASVRLTDSQATEARLRAVLPRREIVHLACHGMADQDYGNSFGCLAIAPGKAGDPDDDGFLYAVEIRQLPLSGCELAILSACQTNYGPQQTGEGVWNLSRAFFVAGARRVVASNWVVDDEAGATLVSYFAVYLARAKTNAADRDYAQALQAAKRQVRGTARWSHPFYWSSLVLAGPR